MFSNSHTLRPSESWCWQKYPFRRDGLEVVCSGPPQDLPHEHRRVSSHQQWSASAIRERGIGPDVGRGGGRERAIGGKSERQRGGGGEMEGGREGGRGTAAHESELSHSNLMRLACVKVICMGVACI